MNATACYFVSAMVDENTEIARGLQRRDPDLIDHLIEKYQHRLLRYLVYLTGRRDLAEDFFQETWIRVLERGRQYDGRHEFGTWLFSIAREQLASVESRTWPGLQSRRIVLSCHCLFLGCWITCRWQGR